MDSLDNSCLPPKQQRNTYLFLSGCRSVVLALGSEAPPTGGHRWVSNTEEAQASMQEAMMTWDHNQKSCKLMNKIQSLEMEIFFYINELLAIIL